MALQLSALQKFTAHFILRHSRCLGNETSNFLAKVLALLAWITNAWGSRSRTPLVLLDIAQHILDTYCVTLAHLLNEFRLDRWC